MHDREVAVALREVTVVHSAHTIIDGLSPKVHRVELVGLLGPSGGGKTTLNRAILGLRHMSAGEITALGRPSVMPMTAAINAVDAPSANGWFFEQIAIIAAYIIGALVLGSLTLRRTTR
jgi:ABC-type transporter Mla maintaining outer membrane lipid asymmetry ATPase subunit MlaF